MSVVRYDKVILKKELGDKLRMVGQEFEIANITEDKYLLRDANTKVAIATVNITEFEEYFEEPEKMVEWTPWVAIFDRIDGGIDAFYRVKGKKVQVRLVKDKKPNEKYILKEASCNTMDEFNLFFGIQLAYKRCLIEHLEREEARQTKLVAEQTKILNEIRNEIKDGKRYISQMINSLPEEGTK